MNDKYEDLSKEYQLIGEEEAERAEDDYTETWDEKEEDKINL